MYQAIVVGTDGSETAAIAVSHATELAKLTGATLHIVSAYPFEAVDIGKAAESERICSRAWAEAEREGVKVQTHVRAGDAADVLIAAVEETRADLLVLGNRGMTGMKRFVLGSVPNKVSHRSPCNLLIVDTTSASAGSG